MDDVGQEVTFDPTAPGTPTPIDVDSDFALSAGVVCPSMVQCMTGDEAGYVITFDPADPADAAQADIDDGEVLSSLSCPSASECVAADEGGDVVVGSGAAVPVGESGAAVTGPAAAGQTLTASSGNWTNGPTSYRYQWQRCNASGAGCHAIAGATADTFVPAAADVGSTVAVVVTALNAAGPSAPMGSSPTAVIQPAPPGSNSAGAGTTAGTLASGGGVTATGGKPARSAKAPPTVVGLKETVELARRMVRFRFSARGDATGFSCALVRLGERPSRKHPRYAACGTSKTYRALKPGAYVFYVRAKGPGGVEPRPVTRRFRIP